MAIRSDDEDAAAVRSNMHAMEISTTDEDAQLVPARLPRENYTDKAARGKCRTVP